MKLQNHIFLRSVYFDRELLFVFFESNYMTSELLSRSLNLLSNLIPSSNEVRDLLGTLEKSSLVTDEVLGQLADIRKRMK